MIKQTCGQVTISADTHGSPVWADLAIDGQTVNHRLSVGDLHDLRYCIDRVLTQLATASPMVVNVGPETIGVFRDRNRRIA
jgi:hypothetical protein